MKEWASTVKMKVWFSTAGAVAGAAVALLATLGFDATPYIDTALELVGAALGGFISGYRKTETVQ